MGCVVSFRSWPPYPHGKSPVAIECEAGRAKGPVWKFRRRETSVVSARYGPCPSVDQSVARLTTQNAPSGLLHDFHMRFVSQYLQIWCWGKTFRLCPTDWISAEFVLMWQVVYISKTKLQHSNRIARPEILEIQSNPVITTSVYMTPRL
jgi:hypothetical protein